MMIPYVENNTRIEEQKYIDKFRGYTTYSVSIKSNEHKEQMMFQEGEYFKEKAKERYKIEAKNSELKHRHGYDVATFLGFIRNGTPRNYGHIHS